MASTKMLHVMRVCQARLAHARSTPCASCRRNGARAVSCRIGARWQLDVCTPSHSPTTIIYPPFAKEHTHIHTHTRIHAWLHNKHRLARQGTQAQSGHERLSHLRQPAAAQPYQRPCAPRAPWQKPQVQRSSSQRGLYARPRSQQPSQQCARQRRRSSAWVRRQAERRAQPSEEARSRRAMDWTFHRTRVGRPCVTRWVGEAPVRHWHQRRIALYVLRLRRPSWPAARAQQRDEQGACWKLRG